MFFRVSSLVNLNWLSLVSLSEIHLAKKALLGSSLLGILMFILYEYRFL